MTASILLVISIIIIFYFLHNSTLESSEIQNQINNAFDNGYIISLGLIPVPKDSSTKSELIKTINYLSKTNEKKSLYKGNKISIKIPQLSNYNELLYLVDFASQKNVFVWISAVARNDLEDEYKYYMNLLKLGYKNVGLTLATYNSDCSKKVDKILKMGGYIRLVKGIYHGDINDWDKVTDNYKKNAEKLIQAGSYGSLATHDVNLLRYLKKKYPDRFDKIELSFFYTSLKYVTTFEKEFHNIKSVYIHFGKRIQYLYHNVSKLDLKRVVMRKLHQLFI